MRRVLIVSYKFPPIGGIGSIRLARFATYLPDEGWEPTVLAPRATPHVLDPDLSFPERKVIRSRSIEFSAVGRAVVGGAEVASAAGLQKRRGAARDVLRAAAHRFLLYPDPQVGWYPGAVAAGSRALRRERFDLIYSSSHPVTAHFVARTLSRRSKLPWVAEFRDPWRDKLPVSHPQRRRAEGGENKIASGATRLITVTPTLADALSRSWGRDLTLIPNGYDEAVPPAEPPRHPTLTHLGTYHPGRQSFRPLWTALQELARIDPGAVPRIRFIGELPAVLRDELESYGLEHLVDVTGFLPHDEAMRSIASSSMLIASGFTGSDVFARAVIPAKLFEYLASDRPILYVGDPADDGAQLLAGRPGCHVVAHSDVAGAREAVVGELAAARRYRRELDHLSRRDRTRDLARVFDEAVTSVR